jgi:2-iminobutanoate/2-iminopropanoate deaminase
MSKKAISTTNAPGAIGPYSQAIRVGDFLFTSGQVALSPATGELVTGGIEAETKQVLANLTAVLTAGGATWADVAKTTIFVVDLADFSIVNRLYGEAAVTPTPARSTVQVAALPRGARVEIEAVAYLGKTSAPAT